MAHYHLSETNGGDKPARYFANGKRVSRDEFERIKARALRDGHLDCFHTKAKQLPGGKFRRVNLSTARW